MIGAVQTTAKASRRKTGFVALLLLAVLCNANLNAFAWNKQSAGESTLRQAIEDPDGAMLNFYDSLMQADEGLNITRIIHYGDSHVAADILTGTMRRKLQYRFSDAGTGFVLAGKPWAWYSRSGVASLSSDGWKVEGLNQASLMTDGRFGLAGVSLSTDRINQWLSMQAPCSRFDIYLMKQPTGGAIDVLLDGIEMYRRVSLAAKKTEPFYLEVKAENAGNHSLEIRTTTQGEVKVFGVAIEHNRAGVVYDALGINGARLYRPLNWDWQIFANNLEHRAANLIIIAYGSNEVSDIDLDLKEYGRNFSDLLNRLHDASPDASLLVIAPPDRAALVNRKWQTVKRMSALVATQRRAAMETGAAFWNLFQAMGGAGSIERWANRSLAQTDRVHLSSAGYKLVAEMLYAEMMRGYLAALLRERKSAFAGQSFTTER